MSKQTKISRFGRFFGRSSALTEERSQSREDLSQPSSASSTPTQASQNPAISKGQNLGITVLYDNDSDAKVDIVFVHGLTGNAYNTWYHKETKVHWPSQLLTEDISDARILAFGYDADIVHFWNPVSVSKLSNHAENLVAKLATIRAKTNSKTRPIIFVTHSLGGLVTEHALSYSRAVFDKHLKQIEQYTTGVVFLGVPHCGADLASWASFGTRMISVLKRNNQDIVGVLEPGSEMLRMVQNGFHYLLRHRKKEDSELNISCFFEELPVKGIGEIVPLRSAEIPGYSCTGIHANHMDMSKFSDRADQGYDDVLGVLQRWKEEINIRDSIPSESARPQDVAKPAENSTNKGKGKDFDSTGGISNVFSNTSTHQGQIFQGSFHNSNFNITHIACSETTARVPGKLWIVPRSSSKVYTGREELGERLTRYFHSDTSNPPSKQKIFVIIGIGGIGKSEVCLKFAEDHAKQYWGVIWINSTNKVTAEQAYINAGRQCKISDLNVENMKQFLATYDRPWLLILDNADNPDIDYSQYIPSGNQGNIIITSRNPECKMYSPSGYHNLGTLENQEAQGLLLRAAHVPQESWERNRGAAAHIVDILGAHTLAIIQAGAYIRLGLASLEEYPELFQEQRTELLKFHAKQSQPTYGNVYATFEVSAKYLSLLETEETTDALQLLHIISFMHNTGLDESIFARASAYTDSTRTRMFTSSKYEICFLSPYHVERLPEYLQNDWRRVGRTRWRKACVLLTSLSLVSRQQNVDGLRLELHPLVHEWSRDRQQDPVEENIAWQSAAGILAFSCQSRFRDNPFFSTVQLHIRACVYQGLEEHSQNIPGIELAQIIFQFIHVLLNLRDDNQSFNHLIKTLPQRLWELDNAEAVLQLSTHAAQVYLDEGMNTKAIGSLEKVVEIRSRTARVNDPGLLASQQQLAIAYRENDQLDECIGLLEHIVGLRKTLPEDDPEWLMSQIELALTYKRKNQLDTAATLIERVLQSAVKLPEDDFILLFTQHNLAFIYQDQKRLNEAITLLEHVVAIRTRLSEDHPDLLYAQYSLSLAYRENRQVDDAVSLLEHVVRVRRLKLPKEHPHRAVAERSLVFMYKENGEEGKAEELLRYGL